jgi:hypothetical protein
MGISEAFREARNAAGEAPALPEICVPARRDDKF